MNDDRQTAGMTDHEHLIGRRFLRRRIDGERKVAHQVMRCKTGINSLTGRFANAFAMRNDELSRRVSIEEHGIAFKKSPE